MITRKEKRNLPRVEFKFDINFPLQNLKIKLDLPTAFNRIKVIDIMTRLTENI